MELEKLKEIIADVLNVEVNDITEDTTFVDDLRHTAIRSRVCRFHPAGYRSG